MLQQILVTQLLCVQGKVSFHWTSQTLGEYLADLCKMLQNFMCHIQNSVD